jgi:YidC/Oxa1 family membrane protein insertase
VFDWLDVVLGPIEEGVTSILLLLHAGLAGMRVGKGGLNWTLSIAIMTVLIRIVMLPLFIMRLAALRKLRALDPYVQALRKKYKADKKRLNLEMQRLYEEKGPSPFSGCLPILVQVSVLSALVRVFTHVSKGRPSYGLSAGDIENFRDSKLFGIPLVFTVVKSPARYHLSSSDTIICRLVLCGLVVLYAFLIFYTFKSAIDFGGRQSNPLERSMLYSFPACALGSIFAPAVLVIYLLFSAMWIIWQQSFIRKKYGFNTSIKMHWSH